MTFDDATTKVMDVANKAENFKIGVTSLPKWEDRLNDSDYIGTYSKIEGISNHHGNEQEARKWENGLIQQFHADRGCRNDPDAGGSGSLGARGNNVVYNSRLNRG